MLSILVRTLFALSFAHEEVLRVGSHVEAQREGEVCVHLLLHHGHHVEGVPHGVEAQDARQFLKASSEGPKMDRGETTVAYLLFQEVLGFLITFSLRGPSCRTASRCTCCRLPACP